MKKKTYVIIIASITAVIAFVQFSGLGQYIRENSIGVSCEDGTCAMKLRDRMMEEKQRRRSSLFNEEKDLSHTEGRVLFLTVHI